MTQQIKVSPIHDGEGRQHLRDSLPKLRAMTDDEAVDALVDLHQIGFSRGAEAAEKVMKEMGLWLSRLVVAHTKQDARGVKAILDEFVAARCIVNDGSNPTPTH